MTYDTLNRTATQALWNHMPGQPYNWDNQVSVIGEPPRHASPLDVPEAWLAPQLRRLIRPFAQQHSGIPNSGPELDIIERGQYSIVEAHDLQASRFPNTFICHECGHLSTVNPTNQTPACPLGHRLKTQFQFAEAHNCGLLREIRAPKCANSCSGPMLLRNWRVLDTRQWVWQCGKCGTRAERRVVYCPDCKTSPTSVLRVPQTSLHYPQSLTVINPPTRSEYTGLKGDTIGAAAVGQLIGAVAPGLDALRAATSEGHGDDKLAQAKATCEALGIHPGDPLYESMMDKARQAAVTVGGWQKEVEALVLPPETLEVIGDEVFSLTRATAAPSLNVDDLLRNPPSADLVPAYGEYRALFDRYKLADVTLLRELPIANVVAGYTRISAHAVQQTRAGDKGTWFKFFPASNGKYPMYGKRTETEGLLVRVKPLEVIRWLVDSGVVPDPEVTDESNAYKWLLRVREPVVDMFNAPEQRITRSVLGLVHSMSHRFMKSIAARCGLNIDSLAEYLFPSALAFLVYANTRSDFTLGGIEHVYRYDLADALSELAADPRCVFDPPCRRSFGGACAACLHTSEISCERFNTVLDRNLLFGTLPSADDPDPAGASDEITWQAFWAP
ncbi:hypothetical protein ACF06N_16330 [Streptomyces albidoflavus]